MRTLVLLVALSGCWGNTEPPNTPIVTRAPTARRTVRASRSVEPIRSPATVEGSFTDLHTGGPGYGITISLVSRATHRTYSAETDINGYYVFPQVEPGEYVLEWELSSVSSSFTGGPRQRPLVVGNGPVHQTILHVGEDADIRYDVTTDLQPPTNILQP